MKSNESDIVMQGCIDSIKSIYLITALKHKKKEILNYKKMSLFNHIDNQKVA